MRRDVAADLDDDLVVAAQHDPPWVGAALAAVDEHAHAPTEREQRAWRKLSPPHREQVAERVPPAAGDAHDAGRVGCRQRVPAPVVGDADPRRDDHHAAVREQLEVHGERRPRPPAAQPPDGATGAHARGRLVARPDADRPRMHVRRRGDHRSSTNRPVASAPTPAANAAATSVRLTAAETSEITAPCRNTPNEPRLTAAAAAPSTAAKCARRAPPSRASTPSATAARNAASPSCTHCTRPFGASAAPKTTSIASAASAATTPSSVASPRRSRGRSQAAANAAATTAPAAASHGRIEGRRTRTNVPAIAKRRPPRTTGM